MRLHSWSAEDPPQINDLVSEEPESLLRGFRVVGVEETRNPAVFRLVLERLGWEDFVREREQGGRWWVFVRDPR